MGIKLYPNPSIRVGYPRVSMSMDKISILIGGFILGMVAPLNFAKLDNLAARDSTGIFENLDWFLLISQITIQLNCFQWHCIFQWYISHLCVALLQLRNVDHIVNS